MTFNPDQTKLSSFMQNNATKFQQIAAKGNDRYSIDTNEEHKAIKEFYSAHKTELNEMGVNSYQELVNSVGNLLSTMKEDSINAERADLEKDLKQFTNGENSTEDSISALERKLQSLKKFNSKLERLNSMEIKQDEPHYGLEINTKTTGDIVSVIANDGTTYSIKAKEHTITKYDANGKVIEERAMTQDEREMETQDLINKLQGLLEKPALDKSIKSGNEQQVESRKNISGKGFNGSYSITDTDDSGYKIVHNMNIFYGNQTVKVFNKGFFDKYGTPTQTVTQPDKSGYYTFRGIKARTYAALRFEVDTNSKEIAAHTAIYKDLQGRKSNGEKLTVGEEKFMSDYIKELQKFGLQMNNKGELEDISTK